MIAFLFMCVEANTCVSLIPVKSHSLPVDANIISTRTEGLKSFANLVACHNPVLCTYRLRLICFASGNFQHGAIHKQLPTLECSRNLPKKQNSDRRNAYQLDLAIFPP